MEKQLRGAAQRHWTQPRLQNLTAGKRLPLHPVHHCGLLHATGLMQEDAVMKGDQVKKFLQINHMISLLLPGFKALAKAMPGHTLHMLDAGCGNSYLGLALAYLARTTLEKQPGAVKDWQDHPFRLHITGIDTREDVIARSTERAAFLGLNEWMTFAARPLHDTSGLPERLHAVLALHACDTATDDALALGVQRKADLIAAAPCCQAELSRVWQEMSGKNTDSPLGVIMHSPNLRREAAATFTDAQRMVLMRALGYEVTATEFIAATHTPKNRLILCERRGRFHKPSLEEFRRLRTLCGDQPLALERVLEAEIAARFPAESQGS